MYRVYVKNYDAEYPLHEPVDDMMRIFSPVLTQEMGAAGTFSFQIHAAHPNYNQLKSLNRKLSSMTTMKQSSSGEWQSQQPIFTVRNQ